MIIKALTNFTKKKKNNYFKLLYKIFIYRFQIFNLS
jgi:hypothetical protein